MKNGELEQLLSQYGHVRDIRRVGPNKRCSAIARYERPEQARNAVATLHNRILRGSKLAVKLDKYEHGSGHASSAPSKDLDSDSSSSRSIWGRGTSSNSSEVRVPQPLDSQQIHKSGPLVVDGAGGEVRRRRTIRNSSDSDTDTDDN